MENLLIIALYNFGILKYRFKLTLVSLSYHNNSGYSQNEIMEILENHPLQDVFIDSPCYEEDLCATFGSISLNFWPIVMIVY
jgi:hypothetical protein